MESPDFSFVELKIVEALIPTKSYSDIADIVNRNVTDVGLLINDLVKRKRIVTLQMKLDNQQVVKNRLIKKIKVIVSKIKEPVVAKVPTPLKIKIPVSVKKADTEKERIRELKDQKKRNLVERLNVEADRKNRVRLPDYKTREVDYSNLITVMIDRRTAIYVKPGADIEAAKKLYLAKVEAQKVAMVARNVRGKVVKKWK